MQENNKQLVPVAIVIAGALIAAAIYFGGDKSAVANPKDNPSNSPTNNVDLPKVTDRDHIRGDKNAPVVIVEYSDTECPFCKVFHSTMKQILTNNKGKVAWVYRHFPIAELHERAMKESEALECAAELGGNTGFWNYTDRLYEVTNSNDSLDPGELPKIAQFVGLDVGAFNACLSSGKYVEAINKSVDEAIKAGARGTPYSVMVAKNGEKALINGAEPISSIQAKIDSLLK